MNFYSKIFAIFMIIASGFQVSHAQNTLKLKGVVKTEDGKTISKANVMLFHEGETDTLRTLTDDKGIFSFDNLRAMKTGIAVSYSGYDVFARYYNYENLDGEQFITDIKMLQGSKTLDAVIVTANKVTIKEDTVSYKIDSTMFKKNDNVEELLTKLPGLEVDRKTGAVTAQGQEVTKVRVNGKDFFGGDVTTATKNLNADMVDRIDVIDDYGDQSAFTGIKVGDASKTLNIQLKKDKNKGFFGNASLGAGTDGRYTNAVTINRFDNERQISLIGNLNNTNTSTFNFGNGGGQFGGALAQSIGGAFGNLGSNSSGIAKTQSLGLNYRDVWSPKISVNGSYSITNRDRNTLQEISRQQLQGTQTIINNQSNFDNSLTDNHRADFNFEYKINKNNFLRVTPRFSFQKSKSDYVSGFEFLNNDNLINKGVTTDTTSSRQPNLSGTFLYNHRFNSKGRVISISGDAGNSESIGDDLYQNEARFFVNPTTFVDSILRQQILQDNNNYNYGTKVSYIEPLSKKKSLEFNYSYAKRYTAIDRENFSIDNFGVKNFVDTASTIYNNTFYTNNIGANFRNNQKKYNYTLGFSVQPATIIGFQEITKVETKQNVINIFPVARFAYNFSRSKSLNFDYNGRSNQPSFNQLQPVADYSNPQSIKVGNPSLRPEFTHRVGARYNNFNFITGVTFFGSISYSLTDAKVVNDVYNRGFGVQETQYRNAGGTSNTAAFYNYSKPFRNRKYVFNYGGNIFYNNNVSFLAGERNNGKNLIFTQRISTLITIKKWLELGGGVNYTLNDAKYSLRKQFNSQTNRFSLSHNARVFLKKDYTFTYDLDKTINKGFGNNVGVSPFIINASAEKLVSKKYNASIKLSAFDLLKENTNVNRQVSGNAITDTRTNSLTRYFLASIVFRFSKFKGTAPRSLGSMPPPPPGM